MREILFRGKRIDNAEWIEGGFLHQTHSYGGNVDCWFIIDGAEPSDNIGNAYEVDPETVCQYTGMTDKNGKKIFEGDIVKFHDSITINGSKIHHSAVEWVTEFSGFLIHADCIGYYSVNPAQVKQYEMEVVGNIFDNPELLTTSPTDSD